MTPSSTPHFGAERSIVATELPPIEEKKAEFVFTTGQFTIGQFTIGLLKMGMESPPPRTSLRHDGNEAITDKNVIVCQTKLPN